MGHSPGEPHGDVAEPGDHQGCRPGRHSQRVHASGVHGTVAAAVPRLQAVGRFRQAQGRLCTANMRSSCFPVAHAAQAADILLSINNRTGPCCLWDSWVHHQHNAISNAQKPTLNTTPDAWQSAVVAGGLRHLERSQQHGGPSCHPALLHSPAALCGRCQRPRRCGQDGVVAQIAGCH